MKTYFTQLPLLNEIKISDNFFKDCILVGAQHLTETTGSLIEKLLRSGIKASDVFLIGKSYSTDPSVMSRLKALGVTSQCLGDDFEPGNFTKKFIQRVDQMWVLVESRISEIQATNPNAQIQLLILDDGGRFISRCPAQLKNKVKISAVEQTTKGIRLEEVIHAPFPVVSVASSFSKTRWESPWIAEGIFEGLKEHLENLGPLSLTSYFQNSFSNEQVVCDIQKLCHNFCNNKFEDIKIGVVGLGHIGQNLVHFLMNKGFQVIVYDHRQDLLNNSIHHLSQSVLSQSGLSQTDLSQSRLSESVMSQSGLSESVLSQSDLGQTQLVQQQMGQQQIDQQQLSYPKRKIAESIEHLINECHLIIGCTGEKLKISKDKVQNIKGKIFASGSSEDIEFRELIEDSLIQENLIQENEIEVSSTDFRGLKDSGLKDSGLKVNNLKSLKKIPILCTTREAFLVDKNYLILSSGFPINFRNATERESKDNIQWTRTLLLGGLIQARQSLHPFQFLHQHQQSIQQSIQQSTRQPHQPQQPYQNHYCHQTNLIHQPQQIHQHQKTHHTHQSQQTHHTQQINQSQKTHKLHQIKKTDHSHSLQRLDGHQINQEIQPKGLLPLDFTWQNYCLNLAKLHTTISI